MGPAVIFDSSASESAGRGQLAAGIAHDFNNMLAVIMGNSDLISLDLPPDSLLRKYNDEIKHASESAARLTQQQLVFKPYTPGALASKARELLG